MLCLHDTPAVFAGSSVFFRPRHSLANETLEPCEPPNVQCYNACPTPHASQYETRIMQATTCSEAELDTETSPHKAHP